MPCKNTLLKRGGIYLDSEKGRDKLKSFEKIWMFFRSVLMQSFSTETCFFQGALLNRFLNWILNRNKAYHYHFVLLTITSIKDLRMWELIMTILNQTRTEIYVIKDLMLRTKEQHRYMKLWQISWNIPLGNFEDNISTDNSLKLLRIDWK